MEHNLDFKNIAEIYETPFYLFDLDKLKDFLKAIYIKNNYTNLKFCYAMKANPFIVHSMSDEVERIEVCSKGEFDICISQKIPFEKIVLSGVYKKHQELKEIFDLEGSEKIIYTIESYEQYTLLDKLSQEYNKKINILIRMTSGNQFGMDAEEIDKVFFEILKEKRMFILGLQYYAGTQRKNTNFIIKDFKEVLDLTKHLEKTFDLDIKEIEFGPGIYFEYYNDNFDSDQYLASLFEIIGNEKYQIIIESGRFLAASCGYYVSSVVDLKNNNHIKYAIIDGGINHINYYGQSMGIKCPKIEVINGKVKEVDSLYKSEYRICGSLCTTSDIIVKNFESLSIEIGDLLVFFNAGAYSCTESLFLFLSRDLPKVLVKQHGKISLGRRQISTSKLNNLSEFLY